MIVHRPSTRFQARPLHAVADLSEVRTAFMGWLRAADVESEQVDDLSVVLSELGANAVRETPAGAPPAEVEAVISGQRLQLTVTNEVSADPSAEVDTWDLGDPLRTGGRGLMLVSAFVDDVAVDVVDRRLVVRCTAAI